MTDKPLFIELVLVHEHSSWWKRKKYRKESCKVLKKYKHYGWKLKKRIDVKKTQLSVDSRFFRKYFLYRNH